jgi:hypothetical protein
MNERSNRFFRFVRLSLAGILCVGFLALPSGMISVKALMPPPVRDQASFEDWLIRTGRPVYSRYRGYKANYEVFSKYKILSYGSPNQVPGNRYDSSCGQYASHGFSYDEYTVTNTYFPEDAIGISDPRKWNNIELGQDAAVSWMRLTAREKEYLKTSPIFYMGRDFNGMTYASLNLTEKKCVVIAVPSWDLGFGLYTNHYNSRGQLRYGTLHGNGIGKVELGGSITTIREHAVTPLVIPGDRDYIDVTYRVRSYISRYVGLAKSSDLACGGIVRGDKQIEKEGSGPWEMIYVVRYPRISSAAHQVTKRTVTEKVILWAVSAMGDPVSRELSYSVTLKEEPRISLNPEIKTSCDAMLSMTGEIMLFRNSTTLLGYDLPFNAHRFLCLERVIMRADFTGDNLPDEVTFFPLGEEPVSMELVKSSPNAGYAEYTHVLKVMPSSLTWTHQRNRASYTIYAQYLLGASMNTISLEGIEITGSVYDLMYLLCDSA